MINNASIINCIYIIFAYFISRTPLTIKKSSGDATTNPINSYTIIAVFLAIFATFFDIPELIMNTTWVPQKPFFIIECVAHGFRLIGTCWNCPRMTL
jgi:hypothetical protein